MLIYGEKISRFAQQKKNILTLVLSGKKILNETKIHNPPLQVKMVSPLYTLQQIDKNYGYLSHSETIIHYSQAYGSYILQS